jgi:hypothetical protein
MRLMSGNYILLRGCDNVPSKRGPQPAPGEPRILEARVYSEKNEFGGKAIGERNGPLPSLRSEGSKLWKGGVGAHGHGAKPHSNCSRQLPRVYPYITLIFASAGRLARSKPMASSRSGALDVTSEMTLYGTFSWINGNVYKNSAVRQ